jgi:hypothetical protein
MNSPRPFFLLPWVAVVLLSSPACISVPDIEPAKAEVRITSPEGLAYTNGVLEIRLEVTGHTPERVELLKDGEVLAEVAAPYVYAWDTAGVAEGSHQLVARAVFGEVTFASEARAVVVDRTPPTVVSRTPEPGAQDVWVKSPIQAVFSEPVKVGTVTSDSVRLTVGGVEVARTVSVSGDGRTVTVVPTTAVTAPNTVALDLSESVTDLAGNKASVPSVNWTWALPRLALYPPLSESYPAPYFMNAPIVRLDMNGNPVVVREEFDGKSMNILVVRWTGSSWEKLGDGLKTRANPDFFADSPSIQIAPDGQPVVAWHEGKGYESENHLHVARWTGTSWEQFGDPGGILPQRTHAMSISLQITSKGTPIIAFNMDPEDVEGAATHVYQWSDTGWSSLGPPLYGDTTSISQRPTLSLDSADNPSVAFTDDQKIYVRRWTGSAWEEMNHYAAAYDRHYVSNVEFAVNSSNKLFTFWMLRDSSTITPEAILSQWDNNEWLPLEIPISTSPNVTSSFPVFQKSSSSQIQASWSEFDETKARINIYSQSSDAWKLITLPLEMKSDNPYRFSPSSFDSDTHENTAIAGFRAYSSRPNSLEPIVYRINQ